MSTPAVTPEVTIANTAPEIKAALEAQIAVEAQPVVVPEAPVAPAPVQADWGQIEKAGDGTYQVKLASGEVFKGTADEVIAKQAEAHVNTKRWGQEWKQKAETSAPPPAVPTLTPEQQSEVLTQEWAAEQVAKFLGLQNAEQLKAAMNQMYGATQQQRINAGWTDFVTACPDYTDSPQNAEALVEFLPDSVIAENRPPTVEEFKTAHARALYEKRYSAAAPAAQPLTTPRPPAMPSSGVSAQPGEPDPYKMPLAELRKLALQGQ